MPINTVPIKAVTLESPDSCFRVVCQDAHGDVVVTVYDDSIEVTIRVWEDKDSSQWEEKTVSIPREDLGMSQHIGYKPCDCRDCMEIAVGPYCLECEEAGCPDFQGVEGMSQECQCKSAYDQEEIDSGIDLALYDTLQRQRGNLIWYWTDEGRAVFSTERPHGRAALNVENMDGEKFSIETAKLEIVDSEG